MTEDNFECLERFIAAIFPAIPIESIWKRYHHWAMNAAEYVDLEKVCIDSTSWGWRITAPINSKAWPGTFGAQQILLENIACLDDAVELCHRLGINSFLIHDTQTANTL